MTALPEGWTIDEEQEPELPPGWKVDEPEQVRNPFKDVVSERLRAQGIEPDVSEEFERAAELGTAEATRGLFSGATFGITENIPGMEVSDTLAGQGGKFIGATLPISGLFKIFQGGPIVNLASKSPVFSKQLTSLANLINVGAAGATYEGATSLAKGEIPSADDLLEHGVEWAALDAILSGLGMGGRFAASLLKRSKATGKPNFEVLNETINALRQEGVDFNQPEIVGAKALEILNRPVEQTAREIKLPKAPESPVETLAKETLGQEPITPKQLKGKKISDEGINRLSQETFTQSEPYLPETTNFTKEAAALEKNSIESQLDAISPRAASNQELGATIKEDIESQLTIEKEAYSPFYQQAEREARVINHNPKSTVNKAYEKLASLDRLKTKPPEYAATIREIENIIQDLGYQVQRKEGVIDSLVQVSDVNASNSIELGRRINNLIDYETKDPNVKNILKPIVRELKQDIRTALKQSPDGLAAFELAEREHARVAKKFGKDSVSKIRKTEAGERVANMANTPTGYQDLKEVLSPKQMKQVEREFLENLNNKSFEQSQKQLREFERHLSTENRKLARDIVEAKNPHNPMARKRITQDAILNDMSNAITTGARPEKTLNLWKSPRGQKLVKETFNNSPNWPQVKGYLEKQSFNDMLSSVSKPNGTIDFKKFNTFMKDPATVNNIRAMGGEEAVTFFKGLEGQIKQMEANVKLLDKLPKESDLKKGKELLKRTKEKAIVKPKVSEVGEKAIATQKQIAKEATGIRGEKLLEEMANKDFPIQARIKAMKEWLKETLGLNAKSAMTVFGVAKIGGAALGSFTLGVPTTVASMVGYRMMNKLLTSPSTRKAFKEAVKKQTNPIAFISAMENFGQSID